MTLQDDLKAIEERAKAAKCPDCDGSGAKAVHVCNGSEEDCQAQCPGQEQCQWCDEHPARTDVPVLVEFAKMIIRGFMGNLQDEENARQLESIWLEAKRKAGGRWG